MAYRFRRDDDSVQDGLRRIAQEQIGRALGEIDDGELDFAERVHQVRKRCKKLRGLIRLVRPAFGDYSAENQAFRDAARLLSSLRDARTLIQTYDAVTGHFEDQIDRRAFAPIRARLTREARRVAADPETRARMQEFRHRMQAVRGRAAKWTLDDAGFDAIAGGLSKTYKRARKGMQEARSDRGGRTMHEWRKRVKYHWYHTRLLSGLVPGMMGPHADAADKLSDLLGDHHDLVVLDARLSEAPEDFGSATDIEAFRALLGKRREVLADKAFALGPLLLAERKKALVKRWGGYWKVWATGDARPDLLLVKV